VRRRAWRQPRVVPFVAALLVALGLLVHSASASFQGSAARSITVTSAQMTITVGTPGAGAFLTSGASDIAPGDTIERVIDLTPAGTASIFNGWTLTTAGTGNNLDDCNGTDHTNGPTCTTGTAGLASSALQVKVEVCSQAWTAASNPYTCDAVGGAQTVLATRTLGFTDVSLSNMSNSAINRLKVTITFPGGSSDDDTNFQNLSTTVTFTWHGVQRSGQYQ
jgi:hypothetical protein